MATRKWKILVLVLGLSGALAFGQEPWVITPEGGLLVNKENSSAIVRLGFKAGVGIYHQIKAGLGETKPAFGLKSGLYIIQQHGLYNALGSQPLLDDNYYVTSIGSSSTRYYLQLPVMPMWRFALADDISLDLAIGPYVGVGIGGNGYVAINAKLLNGRDELGLEPFKDIYEEFNPFEGKRRDDYYRIKSTPRFDWGGTASVGITVRRVSFSIGCDVAFGHITDDQTQFLSRSQMVSFMLGYKL